MAAYPSRKDLKETFEPLSEVVRVKKLNYLIELRIGPKGRYVRLTPANARLLGSALIGLAEQIEPGKQDVVPSRLGASPVLVRLQKKKGRTG